MCPHHENAGSVALVTKILVAAEASWVRDQVRTSLTGPGQLVIEVDRGQDVREAVLSNSPDLVILDLQIANMGGIAVALDLRLEAGAGRIPETPILLLLDREADRFLATRTDADAMLVKPIDAGLLRRTIKKLLSPLETAAVSAASDDA
ncbi:MAG: response regulator [Actinobacteria bacterium]|nr:response regulator [Actinomycetota bacterium]